MRTHHRPFCYESSDFKRMCALVVTDDRKRGTPFVWHVGRIVDWKFNLGNFRRRFPGNYAGAAHLWFSYDDQLIGFVISEELDEQFNVIVLPEYEYLYPDILAWAQDEWGQRFPRLITSAADAHSSRRAALESAGYRPTGDIEMVRIFETAQFAAHPYPSEPLRFESMAENGDYDAQAVLRRSAWPNLRDDTPTDDAIRAYTRTSPIYDARFDFVLVDESGFHLSGCEAFIDRFNNTAEIERVCTHTDHQNRGYSRMTLRACLRALHENHVPTAYLTGGTERTIHVYGSLGHVDEFGRSFYTLDR
ncbi:MAG: N-acetyltransferase [Actinobacteria bacterium]|nr:N-acetyltransferase [Actinomycetota bacterium]